MKRRKRRGVSWKEPCWCRPVVGLVRGDANPKEGRLGSGLEESVLDSDHCSGWGRRMSEEQQRQEIIVSPGGFYVSTAWPAPLWQYTLGLNVKHRGHAYPYLQLGQRPADADRKVKLSEVLNHLKRCRSAEWTMANFQWARCRRGGNPLFVHKFNS
jgi:hypothetical protein